MRRTLYFVMALAMVLGFTQCKKEQVNTPGNETKTVDITLKVGGNGGGSRHDINTTTGAVSFQNGDVIYVGNGSTYIGTLTRTDGVFSGSITEPADGTEIYFFFVGGLPTTPADLSGKSSFTVDISNQSTQMPVLSCNHVTYYSGTTSYSCTLQNQCALVQFTTASTTDPVHVGGLYTEAKIDFANNSITNNGTTGFVALNSKSATEKWAVLLPQTGFEGAEVAIAYVGYTTTIPTIDADAFITGEDAVSISTQSNIVYLDWLTSNYTAANGQTLKGTLGANVQISIAEGAPVTLDGVSINANGAWTSGNYAGISCLGDATIILKDGTTNTVKGFFHNYPGIHIATGHTLTIQGTGSLDASSNGNGSGIGGGNGISCGHILIKSGTITATGGGDAAGIGCGSGNVFQPTSCGDITISGGTVTAANNYGDHGYGAGIGSGRTSSCGNITITDGASVTATKGNHALDCIGRGQDGTCGTVTIGGTVYPSGVDANQSDGVTFVYPVPAPPTAPAGAINGLFSVSATQQVWFSQGNLLNTGNFADNQYAYGGLLQWAASYTTNYSGDWRALTSEEWNYLLTDRANASNLWGFANVEGFNGIILLPDGYSLSINTNHSDWSNNTIDETTWLGMEDDGAVFLPAAGYLDGGSPEDTGKKGYYWCSMSGGYVRFGGSGSSFEAPTCYVGGGGRRSVRLVINVQ